MKKNPIRPDTPLEQLPGLTRPLRERLADMGVVKLSDLVDQTGYGALRRSRGIGPATLAKLAALLQQAGLSFTAPSPGAIAKPVQSQQVQAQAALLHQARDWVHHQQPEIHQRWQRHSAGAYGEYLRAQLDALDQIPASAALLREARNTLVRQLCRYERQCEHATGREAHRDRHRAVSGCRRGT